MDWRCVNIYLDGLNYVVIPVRYHPDVGMVDSEPYYVVDKRDSAMLLKVICDADEISKMQLEDVPKVPVLQKAINAKTWKEAMGKVSLVNLQWNEIDGYCLLANKKKGSAFVAYKKIVIGNEINGQGLIEIVSNLFDEIVR